MEEKQWNIKRVWTVFSFRFLFSYFNLLSLRYVRRLGNDYPSWPADIYAWKHFKMDCRHKNSMRIFPCFIITKWLYCVFKPVFLLWTSVHYSIKKSIVCHFCWRVFESSQASIVLEIKLKIKTLHCHGQNGPRLLFLCLGWNFYEKRQVEKVKLGQMFDNVEGLVSINLVALVMPLSLLEEDRGSRKSCKTQTGLR